MEDKDESYMNDGFPGYEFEYRFRAPESSNGERTSWPIKIVSRETYLWTWYTMLGNVGGNMGLFIGFSFIGVLGSLLDNLLKLWKSSCSNKKAGQKRTFKS